MKGTFKLDNPDAMEATMTVTMLIVQWRALNQVIRKGPYHCDANKFNSLVARLIDKAQSEFTAEGPEGE